MHTRPDNGELVSGMWRVVTVMLVSGIAVGPLLTFQMVIKAGGSWALPGYCLGVLLGVLLSFCKAELAGLMPRTQDEPSYIYIREAFNSNTLGRLLAYVSCVVNTAMVAQLDAAALVVLAGNYARPEIAVLFGGMFLLTQMRETLLPEIIVIIITIYALLIGRSTSWEWENSGSLPTLHAVFSAARYGLYDMKKVDEAGRWGENLHEPERKLPLSFATGSVALAALLVVKMLAIFFSQTAPPDRWYPVSVLFSSCIFVIATRILTSSYTSATNHYLEGYTSHPLAPHHIAASTVLLIAVFNMSPSMMVDLSVMLTITTQYVPVVCGVLVLRESKPDVLRPFIVLFSPFTPLLAIVCLLFTLWCIPSLFGPSGVPILEAGLLLIGLSIVSYLVQAHRVGFWPVREAADPSWRNCDAHDHIYSCRLAPGLYGYTELL